MARFLKISPLLLLWLTACAVNNTDSITAASLSVDGPYEIRAYTSPDVAEYGDATIYYPLNTESTIGAVAISPGFTERQRHINWWGPRLASHGFAVLVFDTNAPRDTPNLRGDALMAAIAVLQSENQRNGGPLAGRVNVDKMAVMGHSMGGGGALLAANQFSDVIKAAIPFTPWLPDGNFSDVSVPTLIIAGSADRIAPAADHAWPHFQSIPDSTPKVYLEISGGDHFLANSGQHRDHATIGRYGIAWLKLYVDGDERYRQFLYGDATMADDAMFSRFITNP